VAGAVSGAPGAKRGGPWSRLMPELRAGEGRAVTLAFCCYFVLLGLYYILRPLRDTMATVFGSGQLQYLFTLTFAATLVCAPLLGLLASRWRLTQWLPGVFGFWLSNLLLFFVAFRAAPDNPWVAGSFFIWFSVVNLYMISVFWSLMVDLFTSEQSTRLFAVIAAGGSIGAIFGPVITSGLVKIVGISGLLLLAAAGLVIVMLLVNRLIREKAVLQARGGNTQVSTFDHDLAGGSLDGFRELLKSPYLLNQAAFMLLMTWVNTVAYFLQTDILVRSLTGLEARTQALADIDLWVNIASAVILLFGLGRFVHRFGLTSGLILNPLLMVAAFAAVFVSPSLLVIQGIQVVRRVAQYAIARPSREMCFTVVAQADRYKAKNVIDTVVYRFGDVSAAWVQAGMRALGSGLGGVVTLGLATSALWAAVAVALGRRFEKLRATSRRV
jgi:AAA family ATP:ADP antiporter